MWNPGGILALDPALYWCDASAGVTRANGAKWFTHAGQLPASLQDTTRQLYKVC
jgi:hypothetical protein